MTQNTVSYQTLVRPSDKAAVDRYDTVSLVHTGVATCVVPVGPGLQTWSCIPRQCEQGFRILFIYNIRDAPKYTPEQCGVGFTNLSVQMSGTHIGTVWTRLLKHLSVRITYILLISLNVNNGGYQWTCMSLVKIKKHLNSNVFRFNKSRTYHYFYKLQKKSPSSFCVSAIYCFTLY